MEFLTQLIDFVLHVDRYIAQFVQLYDYWIYGLLFLIIFLEVGVILTPFLPGDSLLFVVGGLCAVGSLNWILISLILSVAAILGGHFNYWTGSQIGAKLLAMESRIFGQEQFKKTQDFFKIYGPSSIVIARFVPFIRTFAPFVAGMGEMQVRKFTAFNLIGALVWVFGVIGIGYGLGNVPWVKAHIEFFIWGFVLVPSTAALWGSYRTQKKTPTQSLESH
jgi:membrane-associated protein